MGGFSIDYVELLADCEIFMEISPVIPWVQSILIQIFVKTVNIRIFVDVLKATVKKKTMYLVKISEN